MWMCVPFITRLHESQQIKSTAHTILGHVMEPQSNGRTFNKLLSIN